MSERTLVGIPFYEKEGQECLDIALRNVDQCLAKLAIDASVIVQINGPETMRGKTPDLALNPSKYNAEIELVPSDKLSQARAMDDIIDKASQRNTGRVFLTDADIYRFTDSLRNMWNQEDALIVGARYRPYPVEIVEAEFGILTYQEQLLYQIFDGDQLPQVRHTLKRHSIDRKEWVKASLMLVDVEGSKGMHDRQNRATDSVMNRRMDKDSILISQDAFFMHMRRIDMTDHIKARLRHFRAAASLGELETFLHKEVELPNIEVMNKIAKDIRHNYIRGDFYAMLYLCRCAVRERVNEICMQITKSVWDKTSFPVDNDPVSLMNVRTYEDASNAISRFFIDVDWDDIRSFAIAPPSTTQERLRRPFDMTHHLADYNLAKLAITSFMIDEPSGLKLSELD